MKKSFVLGIVVAALWANLAAAADHNWAGCYFGGNAGGGWGFGTGDRGAIAVNNATIAAGIGVPTTYDTRSSGFVGGAQVGCNYQTGLTTWGFETDFQGSGIRGSSAVFSPSIGAADPTNGTAKEELDWFGTLRARAGYTVFGNLLLYGTAGLAYGGVKDNATLVFIPSGDGNYAGSTSDIRAGWTAGAGGEYAFGNRWSMKLEYLYVDLGSTAVQMFDPTRPGQSITYNFQHHDNIVRVGLNYAFGGPSGR